MSKKILDVVRLKRAYEHPAAGDGKRILVDRLWPRGLKKESAAIDQWAKELGHTVSVGASIGVVVAPKDGANVDELVKNADIALYEAKASGRGTHRLFRQGSVETADRRQSLEADLRDAARQ